MKQVYFLVSQHFDLLWRRPVGRYRRIRKEVISTLLDLMKEFPELKFSLVQGHEIRDYLEDCPRRKRELKKFISQGRVEITTGGQAIIDLNLASGESIVRNFYYAREYFRKEFGCVPVSANLADTFGACDQVPQILRLSGIRSLTGIRFVHINDKLQYGNYGAFYWEGQDKSKILAFQNAMGELPVESLGPFYGWGVLEGFDARYRRFAKGLLPVDIRRDVRMAYDAIKEMDGRVIPLNISGEEHMPKREVIKALIDEAKKMNLSVCFATQAEYVAAVGGRSRIPIVPGEHNPVLTGCYSTRIELKQLHRSLEAQLQSAETFYTLGKISQGTKSSDLFNEDWTRLSLLQFHDSLAGCHTDDGYRFLKKLIKDLKKSIKSKAPRLGRGNGNTLFNPLPWERTELVPLPASSAAAGQKCGKERLGLVRLPPLGCGKVDSDSAAGQSPKEYRITTSASSWQANCLSMKRSLFNRSSCAPVVILRAEGGTLWSEKYTGKQIRESASRLVTREDGPLFTRLVFKGKIGSATWDGFESLSWRKEALILADRIQFRVEVEFHGKGTEVVLFFPFKLKGDSPQALYSTPFGETPRYDYTSNTHESGSLSAEKAVFGAARDDFGSFAGGNWPALYYVTLRDKEVGYTLANRGTGGTRIGHDGVYVTVLRSPTDWEIPCFPVKPSALSRNNGTHTFEFCLFSHAPADIPRREALAFSFPPTAVPKSLSMSIPNSLLEITPRNILFSSLKPCENSRKVILRMYESSGTSTNARIRLGFPAKCVMRVDLNEENSRAVNLQKVKFKPFEIVSLQIEY